MPPDFLRTLMAPDRWPTFVLITTRLAGLMATAPLWSMPTMPRTIRAAITLLLALFLLPSAPKAAVPSQVIDLPIPLIFEFVIGLAIGLTAAVFVQGVGLTGEVLSIQMGLSLGPTLDPMADIQSSGVGQLQAMLAVFVYMSVGGHLQLLRGLADSLQALPPGAPIAFNDGAHVAVSLMSTFFTAAVRCAAPVMVSLLLVNCALAILSRAVPQLNVMMVSLPVTIAVGLVMLGLSMPMVAATVDHWVRDLPETVGATLNAFQPATGP